MMTGNMTTMSKNQTANATNQRAVVASLRLYGVLGRGFDPVDGT